MINGSKRQLRLQQMINPLVLAGLGLMVTALACGFQLPVTFPFPYKNNNAASNPAWSPDGKKIVFEAGGTGDGNSYICLMDIDTGQASPGQNPVCVAQGNSPKWSPDGSQFVFYDMDTCNIYRVNADGTGRTALAEGSCQATFNQAPAWSPDGTWIAFSSNRDHLDDEGRHHFDSEIYVIEPDGANLQRLTVSKTANRTPAWSPDSRSIVYYSSDGANQAVIHVLDLADALKNPVPQSYDLTDGSAYESDPAWSPDGQWIVFISTRQGEQDGGINRTAVYRMHIDGSDMQRLTTSELWPREQPSWSPDGQWLVFSVQNEPPYDTGSYDLYIMRPDGSGLRCLTCSSSK